MGNRLEKEAKREANIKECLEKGTMVYGTDGLLYKNNISKSGVLDLFEKCIISKETKNEWINPRTSVNPAGVSIRKQKWEEFKGRLGSNKPRKEAYHGFLDGINHAADTITNVAAAVTTVKDGMRMPVASNTNTPLPAKPTNGFEAPLPTHIQSDHSVSVKAARCEGITKAHDTYQKSSYISNDAFPQSTWESNRSELDSLSASITDCITTATDPIELACKFVGAMGKAQAKEWCDANDFGIQRGKTEDESSAIADAWCRHRDL